MKICKTLAVSILIIVISPIGMMVNLETRYNRVGYYQIDDYRPAGIVVEESIAYITGYNLLEIVNVSNVDELNQISQIEIQGPTFGLTKIGNLIYTVGSNNGSQIIDVSAKTNPAIIGNISEGNRIWDIYVEGNIGYVPREGVGLEIINLTDSDIIGKYTDLTSYATIVKVEGKVAYMGELTNGIKAINISDPENPSILGQYTKYVYDFEIKEKIAYIITYGNKEGDFWGLEIVNMTNPSNPIKLSTIGFHAHEVELKGESLLIVSNEKKELREYDISNPKKPKRIGLYKFNSDETIFLSGKVLDAEEERIYLCTIGKGYEINIISTKSSYRHITDIGIRTSAMIFGIGVVTIALNIYRYYIERKGISTKERELPRKGYFDD